MRNKPTGTDLIFVARRTLVDSLIPNLSDDLRPMARQIARAMNIAGREIEAGDWPLRRALERIVEILGKEAKYDAEYAQSTPGALDRTLGEMSAELSRRIREGEFDGSGALREEIRGHLLGCTLDKLREDDPKYLEDEGFE